MMIEERIKKLINPLVDKLGFDIVKISFNKVQDNKNLEIFIERKDLKPVSVADCTLVTKSISYVIDVEDLIKEKYFLCVSSCGLERPLISIEDFKKFTEKKALIKFHNTVEGVKKLQGIIKKVDNNIIILKVDNREISIPSENIKSSNLIFTDEDFKQNLKQNKKNLKDVR